MHGHCSSCIDYFNNFFSLLRLTLISTLFFSFHITALTFVLFCEIAIINSDRKGSTLQCRWCDYQGTHEHQNRYRYRSRQRRHSDTGFRSEHSNSMGELERVALLPG